MAIKDMQTVPSKRTTVKPNDVVLHKPSGEKWVVAGVDRDCSRLIPMGYPFPTIAKLEDCELLECHYETHPQDENVIRGLLDRGLTSFIDPMSAMLHGLI